MNMKKILALFLSFSVILTSACNRESRSEKENSQVKTEQTETSSLSDKQIYFFHAMGCPHCHDALSYIKKKYPNLHMEAKNVASSDGYELFLECADKFNLGRQIGTPLFCMGKNYIMGWGKASEKQFDEYVKPYIK